MGDWVYRRPYRRPPQRQRWIPTSDSVTTTVTPAIASLTLSTFAPTITISAGEFYRTLTIDHTLVPNTDQTDFPVLVSLTHADLKSISNGGHVANNNGFDILCFSDAALTSQLSHEIEKYDPATGEVVMWVKVPSVSHTADTTFYMKYGDTSITSSQEDVADVWSNGFAGVWHLGNGSTLNSLNSVSGGSGSITGATASSGKVHGAGNFASATDKIVTDLTTNSTQRTYTVWARRHGEGGGGHGRVFQKGTSGGLGSRDTLFVESPFAANTYEFLSNHNPGFGDWTFPKPSIDVFHYIVVAYDDSSNSNDPTARVDKIAQTVTRIAAPTGSPNGGSEAYNIGNRLTNDRNWDGDIDELHIADVIRSDDWTDLEFNNQNDPTAFLSLSAEFEVGDVVVTPSPATLTTTRFAPALKLTVTPASTTQTLSTFAPSVTIRVTVTPATGTLTTIRFAPQLRTAITPVTHSLGLTSFVPSLKVVITPSSQSLVVVAFTPAIRQSVTPANASLTLTTFASSLITKVTVPNTSLSLTAFAPTVAASAGATVIPANATLSTATFAPTLKQAIIPSGQSLTTTRFAPKLIQAITPSSGSLALSTFAPTIRTTTVVSPNAALLSTTRFAPTLLQSVIPSAASLTLNTFAPVVNVRVTPAKATLTLSLFVPSLVLRVTPGQAGLTLNSFAPAVTVGGNVSVTPSSTTLTLTAFTPTLSRSVIVPTVNLALTTFAPQTTQRTSITPASVSLTTTSFAPQLNLQVTPSVTGLSVTTFAPAITIQNEQSQTFIPTSASLILVGFAPTVKRRRVDGRINIGRENRTIKIATEIRVFDISFDSRVL